MENLTRVHLISYYCLKPEVRIVKFDQRYVFRLYKLSCREYYVYNCAITYIGLYTRYYGGLKPENSLNNFVGQFFVPR